MTTPVTGLQEQLHGELAPLRAVERACLATSSAEPRVWSVGGDFQPPTPIASTPRIGLAVCASCGSRIYPSRPQKGPKYPGERYAYYREASPDFNRECVDAGLLWPSDSPDQQVDELMLSLAMSREWLGYVAAEALKLPEDVVEHRRELEETLRRVQKDYFGRRLDESEYLALRRTYEGELALLPVARRDLINALEQLESFGDLWVPASAEARNDACRTVFDRVILDMRNRSIELCPSPEFEPLFQLRHALHVTDIRPVRGSR